MNRVGLSILYIGLLAMGAGAATLDASRFQHTAADSHLLTRDMAISVGLSNAAGVSSVTVYYKSPDLSSYRSKAMQSSQPAGTYSATVSSSELSPLGLTYYFEAAYKDGGAFRSGDYATVILIVAPSILEMLYRDDASGIDVKVAKGELIFKIDPSVSAGLIPAAINTLVIREGGKVLAIDNAARLVRMQVPATADLKTLMQDVEAQSSVEYAQPNGLYEATLTPNDPRLASQWGTLKIRMLQAWDVTTGDPNVIVSVIDSGRDPIHPDLSGVFLPGYDYYDNDPDPSDVAGHGTMVSGVIAAVGNNGKGVAGVNWQCRILPYRVGNQFLSTWAIIEALRAAADAGARVVNMSFGSGAGMQAEHEAIQYAYNKGVVLVASAGNSYTTAPIYPAAYPEVIGVVATTSDDQKAAFSSYGNWVDVSAPGQGILTTTVGGGYGYVDGTSFSSPYTAGVASLVLSVNPTLTNDQVREILRQTAVDLGAPGFDPSFGYGRINAEAAVLAARQSSKDDAAPTITHSAPATVKPGVSITIAARIKDNVSVHSATLSYRRQGQTSYVESLMRYLGGDTFEGVIPKDFVAPPGVDYKIAARDMKGNVAQTSAFVVPTEDVTPPNVQHTPPDSAETGRPLTLTASITDDVAVAEATMYARVQGEAGFERYEMHLRSAALYEATIPDTRVHQPAVEYYFAAGDPAGNSAVTGNPGSAVQPHSISVKYVDRNGPVITHTPIANGQMSWRDVHLTATIGDDVGVTSARIFFRTQGQIAYESAPLLAKGGNIYEGVIPGRGVVRQAVEYYLDARDAAQNVPSGLTPGTALRPNVFIVAVDTIPPTIRHQAVGDTPEQIIEGVPVKLSAVALDNRGVREVLLKYKNVSAPAFRQRAMTYTISNRYEATFTEADDQPPALEYSLIASDTDGNETTWGPVRVAVHPRIAIPTPRGDTNAYWVPTASVMLWKDSQAGNFVRLNIPSADTARFAWSTDLTKLVMTGKRSETWFVYVIQFKDTMPTAYQVTQGKWTDLFPSWSADGKYLLFASNRNGDWDIFMTPWDSDGDGIPDSNGVPILISTDSDVALGAGEIAGVARLSAPRTDEIMRGRVAILGGAFGVVEADRLSQVPAESYRVVVFPESSPSDVTTLAEIRNLTTILFDAELARWDVPKTASGRHDVCLYVKGNRRETKECVSVWLPKLSITLQAAPSVIGPGQTAVQVEGEVSYNYGSPGSELPVTIRIAGQPDVLQTRTNGSGRYATSIPAPIDPGFYQVSATVTDTYGYDATATAMIHVVAEKLALTLNLTPSETYPFMPVLAAGQASYGTAAPLIYREVALEIVETQKRYFALTDTDGRYSIALAAPEIPGVYTVHAHATDGVSIVHAEAPLKVKAPEIDISELLAPPVVFTGAYTSVSGTAVYHFSGRPLIDKTVTIRPSWISAAMDVKTDSVGRYIAIAQAPATAGTYPIPVSVTDGYATATNQQTLTVANFAYGIPMKLEATLRLDPVTSKIGRKVQASGEISYVYQSWRWPVESAGVQLAVEGTSISRTIQLTGNDGGKYSTMLDAPKIPDTYVVRVDAKDVWKLSASAETDFIVIDWPLTITAHAEPPDPYRNDAFHLKGSIRYPDGSPVQGAAMEIRSDPPRLTPLNLPANARSGDFDLAVIAPNIPDTYVLTISAADTFGGTGSGIVTVLVRPLSLLLTASLQDTMIPARAPAVISGSVVYRETAKASASAQISIKSVPGRFGSASVATTAAGNFLEGMNSSGEEGYETFEVTASDGWATADTQVSGLVIADSIVATLILDTDVAPAKRSVRDRPSGIGLTAIPRHPKGLPLFREGIMKVWLTDSTSGAVIWQTAVADSALGQGRQIRQSDRIQIPIPTTAGQYRVTYWVEDRYGIGESSVLLTIYPVETARLDLYLETNVVRGGQELVAWGTISVDEPGVDIAVVDLQNSGTQERWDCPYRPAEKKFYKTIKAPLAEGAYPIVASRTVNGEFLQDVEMLFVVTGPPLPPEVIETPGTSPSVPAPRVRSILVTVPPLIEAVPGSPVVVEGSAHYSTGEEVGSGTSRLFRLGSIELAAVPLSNHGRFRYPAIVAPSVPTDYEAVVNDGTLTGRARFKIVPPPPPPPWTPVIPSPQPTPVSPTSPSPISPAQPSARVSADTTYDEFYPVQSPDGKYIAYSRRLTGTSDPLNVYILRCDSPAVVTAFTTENGNDQFPDWSPDGKYLAFGSKRSGNYDIWIKPVDGNGDGVPDTTGEARQLTTWEGEDNKPTWSPDGQKLAFHSDREGNYDIFVQSLIDASPAVRLTTSSACDAHPHWSSDGRYIVFHSNRPGRVALNPEGTDAISIGLVLDQSGSIDDWSFREMSDGVIHLVNNLNAGMPMSVTHFGHRAKYVQDFTEDRKLLRKAAGERSFYSSTAMYDGLMESMSHLTDRHGRRIIILVSDGWDNASSKTEADVLTYAREYGIVIHTVYVQNPNYPAQTDRLKGLSQATGGQYLEIDTFEDVGESLVNILRIYNDLLANFNIWVMPVSGGAARQLTDHIADDLYPAFSPDVKKIAFVSFRSGHGDIYVLKFDPNSTEPPKILYPPVARARADTILITVDVPVGFDASASSDSDGWIDTYVWDFGDGTRRLGVTDSHVYATPGTYVVRLTVIDNDGLTGNDTRLVEVMPKPIAPVPVPPRKKYPPVAVARVDTNLTTVGTWLLADGSQSSDSDGKIDTYVWEFGDSGVGRDSYSAHSYTMPGAYVVRLVVTDTDGLSDDDTCIVVILPKLSPPHRLPPVAIILADTTHLQHACQECGEEGGDDKGGEDDEGVRPNDNNGGHGDHGDDDHADDGKDSQPTCPGFGITFDGRRSFDPDGRIVSYAWNFGDSMTGVGETVAHQYDLPGTYVAVLKVTDNDGLTADTGLWIVLEHVCKKDEGKNGKLIPTLSWKPSGMQDDDSIVLFELRNMSNDRKDVAAGVLVCPFVIDGTEYVDTVLFDTYDLGMMAAEDIRPVWLTVRTNAAWEKAKKSAHIVVELRVVQELNWPQHNVSVSSKYHMVKTSTASAVESLSTPVSVTSASPCLGIVVEFGNPSASAEILNVEKSVPPGIRLRQAILPGGSADIEQHDGRMILALREMPFAPGETFAVRLYFEASAGMDETALRENLQALAEGAWIRSDSDAAAGPTQTGARQRVIRGTVAGADSSTVITLFDVTAARPKKFAEVRADSTGNVTPPEIPDAITSMVVRIEKPQSYPVFRRVEIAEGKITTALGILAPDTIDARRGLSIRVDSPDVRQEASAGDGLDRAHIDVPPKSIDHEYYIELRDPANLTEIKAAAAKSGQRVLVAKEYVLIDAQTGEEMHSGFAKKIHIGLSIAGLKGGESARLAYFDPSTGEFESASNASVDSKNDEIAADVEHFSTYVSLAATVSAAASAASFGDFSQLLVYPNPYEASFGTNKIVFENVPATARLSIYTISGEKIIDITNDGAGDINGSTRGSPATAHIGWDLTTRFGRPVASGMYLFVLRDDAGNVKRGRVGIVR